MYALKNSSRNNRFLYLLMFILFLSGTSIRCEAMTRRYNVKDFGADGTDKKSDYDAIQEALDQASEDHMTVVIVPNGTYYIDGTLYIQSNTTLKLSSHATIKRKKSALANNMLRTTNARHFSGFTGGYRLAHNITVTGGTWDGGDIAKAKKTSNLIYMGHSKHITIKNTTIKHCYGAHAIEFAGVKDSTIKNCKISEFRYDSSRFTSEAIQLDTCYKSKKDGRWTPGFKADKTPCTNILIEKNTITDYPRGIGVHHYLKDHLITNITIRDNRFKRSSASTQGKSVVGIFLMGVTKATITQNTFDHYAYGAMVKLSKKVSITKNNFKYNPSGNLIVEGCDKNNGRHTFRVTSDDINTTKFEFTCGNISSGTVKTGGRTYYFHKKGTNTITLSDNLYANQQVDFYGKDDYNNKYYRTYYVPRQTVRK